MTTTRDRIIGSAPVVERIYRATTTTPAQQLVRVMVTQVVEQAEDGSWLVYGIRMTKATQRAVGGQIPRLYVIAGGASR